MFKLYCATCADLFGHWRIFLSQFNGTCTHPSVPVLWYAATGTLLGHWRKFLSQFNGTCILLSLFCDMRRRNCLGLDSEFHEADGQMRFVFKHEALQVIVQMCTMTRMTDLWAHYHHISTRTMKQIVTVTSSNFQELAAVFNCRESNDVGCTPRQYILFDLPISARGWGWQCQHHLNLKTIE